MTNNSNVAVKPGSEIVFDDKSGISKDEQREILAEINGIAERNRRSLSLSSAVPAGRIKAKKNGGLFPFAVNFIAIIFLAGGFFFLSSLHSRNDERLREGVKVFSPAERALINEIRKETLLQIEEKENEKNQIIAQMEEVDLQLQELYSSNLELTAEQRAAAENLKNMQDEYRRSLSAMEDDRSQILESARSREAALYARLEARNREAAAVFEQSDPALAELGNLSDEQEKAAAIEAQLANSFASANELIRGGRFDEAAEILSGMRQFINAPAFQGLRSFQARKGFYTRSIDVLETLADEARKNQGGAIFAGSVPAQDAEKAIAELAAENARLQETIAGLNRTIAANSRGSNTNQRRLGELETTVATLRNSNSALEATAAERQKAIAERDNAIAELRSENAALSGTVATRDREIRELHAKGGEQEELIQSLDTQLTSLRQALQALTQ